jgi:hypothetical protein
MIDVSMCRTEQDSGPKFKVVKETKTKWKQSFYHNFSYPLSSAVPSEESVLLAKPASKSLLYNHHSNLGWEKMDMNNPPKLC